MVMWNIRNRMAAKGWKNAHQLATGAGLSYPVAVRILGERSPKRIDVETLEKLATALGVKDPLQLLTFARDDDAPPPRPSGKPAVQKRKPSASSRPSRRP